MKMARLRKYLGLILFCLVLNAHAFDTVKLDQAVASFLDKWFAETCSNIKYSFIFALYVEEAYNRGFYAKGVHPSEFSPPKLPTDIFVNIKTDICERDIEGYAITLRKTATGYKVIGYSAFNQPE